MKLNYIPSIHNKDINEIYKKKYFFLEDTKVIEFSASLYNK